MNASDHRLLNDLQVYLQAVIDKGLEWASRHRVDPASYPELEQTSGFAATCFQYIELVDNAYLYQKQLAAGDLSVGIDKQNYLAMPLKELQANLRHLTWQAQQVAKGDFSQRVHFMGDFADSFNAMILALNEQETLQQERSQLQEQLFQSQKLEAVGRLAAGMAHEINTPAHFIGINLDFIQQAFTDVISFTEQVQLLIQAAQDNDLEIPSKIQALEETLAAIDWDYLSEEVPKALNQSQGGIARVAAIINTLKEFSRPVPLGKTLVDLNQLIAETVAVSASEWNRVAEITAALDPHLPFLPLLEEPMRQVLFNLLVNSAQAIEDQQHQTGTTSKGTITVQSRRGDAELVEIAIRDSGVGISDAVINKIFDPFFTTKEVGRGTGQGLTVVHDIIVNKHGGSLQVASESGVGTTFFIKLPCAYVAVPGINQDESLIVESWGGA
jgi:signal transduction histidine kinase